MTGYGEAQFLSDDFSIEVKIRSVNGRFLETRMHLPKDLFSLESELKKIIENYFHRGTVDVFVSLSQAKLSTVELELNSDLVKQYQKQHQQICKILKLKTPIHPESVMRWPEVVQLKEVKKDDSQYSKKLFKKVSELTLKAVKACDQEKIREGGSLIKELSNLLGLLEAEVKQIELLREEANLHLENRIRTKLESRILEKIKEPLDPQRVAQEVIFQIEKSDITEEIIRLQEHLRNYHHLLKEEKIGKKMDFYTQELLREANTIGSKSGLSSLTQRVVESKAIIERIREQVQNIE